MAISFFVSVLTGKMRDDVPTRKRMVEANEDEENIFTAVRFISFLLD